MALTREDLVALAREKWYYQIELGEGLITAGKRRDNMAVYRDFLPRIDLHGQRCLDIGTQEFAAPILMLRQGAKSVVAYDRHSYLQKYLVMKECYGVEFEYVNSISLQELKPNLRKAGTDTSFDYVQFAGVLYHMIDPLAGLAMARSFLRSGGLMLIETKAYLSDKYVLLFNYAGTEFRGNNYFGISVATLDYWIRMLRMEALDCVRWKGRLLVVCRAIDSVRAEPKDRWIRGKYLETDFQPYGLAYNELASDAPPVPYREMEGIARVYRKPEHTLDLFATTSNNSAYEFNENQTVLRLADQY